MIPKDAVILWVDFQANGVRLANLEEQQKLVRLAKEAGVTHIVVDAKIPYGHTTYLSTNAPHVSTWSNGMFDIWKDRDFLMEMIEAAHAVGLNILANMDVFAEGTTRSRDGIAYERKEWQVLFHNPNLSSMPVAAENASDDTIFVNPIHPEVIAYELSIVKEIVSNYNIEGIVLDRCRYPNIYGDFSELSRQQFERYLGHPLERFPDDIFTVIPGTKDIEFGPWFPQWTEWRALNIKNFVRMAKTIVKTYNPKLSFSIYVGSWYPLYYSEGVNWASETYHCTLPWASETYHRSAYADELDFIMTGCYYPEVTIEEAKKNGRPADWYSVEGAINISNEAINGQIPMLGSLYLKDYEGDIEQFRRAIQICLDRSSGVMLFDAVYLEKYNWWDKLPDLLQRSN